jgi:hypothetical protein
MRLVRNEHLFGLPSLYYIFFGTDSLGEEKTVELKQPETEFFNFQGAKESIPRNQFRQAV